MEQKTMKSIKKQTSFLFTLAIMTVLTVSLFAQKKKDSQTEHHHDHGSKVAKAGEFLGLGDGIETCPVTGDAIESKDIKGTFFGRTVYFCCQTCLASAKKNPAAFLKKTQEEQVAAIGKLAGKSASSEDHHAAEEKSASEPAKSEDHHAAEEKTQDKQPGEKKFLGKGDGIETCPVTGEPISKDFKDEINGRTVYVCCPGCLDTIKEAPELYLKDDPKQKDKDKDKEKKPEEKKEETFLGKGDGIETCPVMGMPVDKSVKIEINGRTVYACCPGCLDTIKANPDLYLKKTEDKK
jgi:YHS domain-containing protein